MATGREGGGRRAQEGNGERQENNREQEMEEREKPLLYFEKEHTLLLWGNYGWTI